jgi:hypothetical protein
MEKYRAGYVRRKSKIKYRRSNPIPVGRRLLPECGLTVSAIEQ